jgi:hypothetical protein
MARKPPVEKTTATGKKPRAAEPEEDPIEESSPGQLRRPAAKRRPAVEEDPIGGCLMHSLAGQVAWASLLRIRQLPTAVHCRG